MSSLSLTKSITTCKVDTAQTDRIQSDRFLNPKSLVCPTWNGLDNLGRHVNIDSFYTKSAGCNLATDRVDVENFLRPKYFEYVSLDASGVNADIYGPNPSFAVLKTQQASMYDRNIEANTPNFGSQFQATNVPSCGMDSYERAMASQSQANRGAVFANSSYRSNQSKCGGGML